MAEGVRRRDTPIDPASPDRGSVPAELEAVQATLNSGWVVQGPRVAAFEQSFASMVGTEHAIAMSSCTTALHASVLAMGAGPGDEVIVPAFTWVATANAVEQTGAKPVFADISLDTFNLDEAALRRLITPRTVGILPVHLFGLAADLDPILDIATHASTVGNRGCCLCPGRRLSRTPSRDYREDGMLQLPSSQVDHDGRGRDGGHGRRRARKHPALSARSRRGSRGRFGLPPSAIMPSFPRLGFNYRMTDIQGAIGSVQLGRASWLLIEERIRIARRYDEGLGDLAWLRTPIVPQGHKHAYQSYVLLVTLGEDDPLDGPSGQGP